MPYPPRPQLRPLAEFAGTASPRPDPAVQARVEAFLIEQYLAGRSLRELAELTERSFSVVRNILDKHGVRRRGLGAAPLFARDPMRVRNARASWGSWGARGMRWTRRSIGPR